MSVSRRRVMYFSDSAEFSGAEQVLLTLMAGLDREQWRMTLVHRSETALAPLAERAARFGAEVRALPPQRGGGALGRVEQAVKLARLIRTERPDVFHANLGWPLAAKYALVTAAASAVPAVIATVHTFDVPISRRRALLLRAVTSRVDRYVAVCSFVANYLHSRLAVPPSKVRTVSNGIPVEEFTRGTFRPELRRELGAAGRQLVLTPARLDPLKGHAVLIEAARQLPDAVFAFAGDGPLRDSLETRAAQLGVADQIRFLGRRADMLDLLATSDLVVLPSLCEGYSLALLEAMAAGKPVVSTSVGGNVEIVRDGESGLLVPPGDSLALSVAIGRLLADPACARRLAHAASLQAHREFRAERMIERVEAVYADALAHSTRRRYR